MGEVRARWCFTAIDGTRRFYATAKLDTGSTAIVLPFRDARRIGVLPRTLGVPDPGPVLDAQKQRIPGEWFLIGEARAVHARHNCHFAPVVLVFGQKGR